MPFLNKYEKRESFLFTCDGTKQFSDVTNIQGVRQSSLQMENFLISQKFLDKKSCIIPNLECAILNLNTRFHIRDTIRKLKNKFFSIICTNLIWIDLVFFLIKNKAKHKSNNEYILLECWKWNAIFNWAVV